MYRQQGSRSVLAGVASGPYTGGARLVDAARLQPATRERLAAALGERGGPVFIVANRLSSMRIQARAWAALGAGLGSSSAPSRSAGAVTGTPDERVYAALTARAFDRLYDELYGLFFAGDPKVVLHERE